ncbi:MAG: transglutaminase domain-containing protein [Planctomycetota bacterium]
MTTAADSTRSFETRSRWVLGGLHVLLVWFVGSTFGTLVTSLAVAVSLLFFGWLRSPGHRPASSEPPGPGWLDATILVTGVLGVLTWIPAWRFFPHIQSARGVLPVAIDTLAHLTVFLSFVLWIVWPGRGHVMMLVLGLWSIMMAVAGGGVSTTVTSQTGVAIMTAIGYLTASQLILSASMRRATRSEAIADPSLSKQSISTTDRWFSGSRPISMLWLVLVLTLTSGLINVTQRFLPELQSRVFASLKDQLEGTDIPGWAGGTRYVHGGRLGGVRSLMLADPQSVALRGYCDEVPGYLRGNAFDHYRSGRWTSRRRWEITTANNQRPPRTFELARVPPSGPGSTVLRSTSESSTSMDAYNRFELMTESGLIESGGFVATVEIRGDPVKGSTTFTPLTTGWVDASADELAITVDRLVRNGINPTDAYVAGVMQQCETEDLTQLDLEAALDLDESFRNRWQSLASGLVGRARTSSEKANIIAEFFQSQFEYSMDVVPKPDSIDSLDYFLQQRHPAHCEMFASATTLLLRCVGVPTRYVTGYVMDEITEDEESYLARNSDAHAWVEYYDLQRQRWKALEPTPGRVYQTLRPDELDIDENDGSMALVENLEADRSGWWSALATQWRAIRATDSLVTLFRWLQVPFLIFLAWVLWRQRRDAADSGADRERLAQRRAMDRYLRRFRLIRDPSETLHQFADRIERWSLDASAAHDRSGSIAPDQTTKTDEMLVRAARWYRRHATFIYRPPTGTE